MRETITFTIFLFFISTAFAQQAPQYSLYMLNKYSFNPAYAGLDNSLSITGVLRKQWTNLESSPLSQNFNAHIPMYYLNGGLGINLENDEIGAEKNSGVSISYNYFLPVSKTSLISIGVAAGATQKSLDGSILRAPQGGYSDPPINHEDDLIPTGPSSALAPTFSAGLYFYSEKFEVGLATSHLNEPFTTFEAQESVDIQYIRNYFFNFAIDFELSRSLSIEPSMLLKSDLIQTQIEFSALIKYNDNIFGGASFRGYNANSIDAVAILAGYKINERVTLAYSYDLTLSGLKRVSNGSHELMINYNLNKPIGKGIPPNIIYNPRFL